MEAYAMKLNAALQLNALLEQNVTTSILLGELKNQKPVSRMGEPKCFSSVVSITLLCSLCQTSLILSET
jgi:hypothetical protein